MNDWTQENILGQFKRYDSRLCRLRFANITGYVSHLFYSAQLWCGRDWWKRLQFVASRFLHNKARSMLAVPSKQSKKAPSEVWEKKEKSVLLRRLGRPLPQKMSLLSESLPGCLVRLRGAFYCMHPHVSLLNPAELIKSSHASSHKGALEDTTYYWACAYR